VLTTPNKDKAATYSTVTSNSISNYRNFDNQK
jgi:hypothetical protein